MTSSARLPSLKLSTRLAMAIGGARALRDVDDDAWDQLARDIQYRPATLRAARASLQRRAAEEALRLIATPEHDNPSARAIATRIGEVAGPV